LSKAELSERLLNTDEAARYLRVSKASIRRWSDAGLIASRRVGGRRERRFREADLVAYLGRGGVPPPARHDAAQAQTNVGGVALSPHSHVATFYNSDAGRMRLTIPFLVEGIRAGQPCILAADGDVLASYLDPLREAAVDIESARRTGQLVVVLDGLGSTVESALDFWEQHFWQVLKAGQTIRVVGEMACERKVFGTDAELMRYEAAYEQLAARFPTVTLCQFDVREFDGEMIFHAIRAHPDLFALDLRSFLN
jgi:transcriptional repressor of dcmA and dcmR